MNDLIAERFGREDRPERFVMDGYPRTLGQAASFDQVLRQQFLDLAAVVLLIVSDEEIVRRLSGRDSCPKPGCKATYHTESNPPRVPGVCDYCGTALVQRDDDKVETVQARLIVYHKNTGTGWKFRTIEHGAACTKPSAKEASNRCTTTS